MHTEKGYSYLPAAAINLLYNHPSSFLCTFCCCICSQCPVWLLFFITAQPWGPCYTQPLSWRAQRCWLGEISGGQQVWLPAQERPVQSFLLLTVQWIYRITISYCPHQYCIQVMSDPVCQDYSGFPCCLQSSCKSSPLGTSCRFNGCLVQPSHQWKSQIE